MRRAGCFKKFQVLIEEQKPNAARTEVECKEIHKICPETSPLTCRHLVITSLFEEDVFVGLVDIVGYGLDTPRFS
jgi:hypothetical protein